MAKKTGILILAGIGALLLASSAGAEEEKPSAPPGPEPLPPGPGPLPPGPGPLPPAVGCVRTSPGDKGESVLAWQRCLIAAGCLAAGQDDGIHGPVTESASRNYEESDGNCAPTTGVALKGAASYELGRSYALDGAPQFEVINTFAVSDVSAEEDADIQATMKEQAEGYYQKDPQRNAGVYQIARQNQGSRAIVWQKTYGNPNLSSPPGVEPSPAEQGGDLIASTIGSIGDLFS